MAFTSTAAFTDDLSDFVSTDRVGDARFSSQSLFLGKIGLQVILRVSLELSVEIFVLELDPLLLPSVLPLESFSPLVSTIELLDSLRCISFFLLLRAVQFVKMSLGSNNSWQGALS